MSIAERLSRLEEEVAHQAAVIDGSEAQTREAVVTVIGLVVRYLMKKGSVDLDDLIAFLADSADPEISQEDHNGRLIHDLRKVLEFHRDDAKGLIEAHVPLDDLLPAAEIARIGKEAREQFEAERAQADGRRKLTKAKRPQKRTSVH